MFLLSIIENEFFKNGYYGYCYEYVTQLMENLP